jgi:cytochrome P450
VVDEEALYDALVADRIRGAGLDVMVEEPPAPEHKDLPFGFGIHRCVGNLLAETQLTILWKEILKRFPPIEVVEKPKRAYSNLIHGITEMKVRIPA